MCVHLSQRTSLCKHTLVLVCIFCCCAHLSIYSSYRANCLNRVHVRPVCKDAVCVISSLLLLFTMQVLVMIHCGAVRRGDLTCFLKRLSFSLFSFVFTGKKKSKFQTFKKFFARKKRKEPPAAGADAGLKASQSSDNVSKTSENNTLTRSEKDKGSA